MSVTSRTTSHHDTPRPGPGHHTGTETHADTPPGRAAADAAALWLDLLNRQFPELLTELVPGPGPGTTTAGDRPHRTPDRLAADSARVRAERRDALLVEQRHGLAVPGHSTAPLRLHISDAIRDITDGVVELEEAVHDKLALGRPRRATVPERLERLARLLDRIAAHRVLAAHVRDETRRMARRCGRALGDTEPMARVGGRCPWCDSVSLRAFPSRGAVLCVNPACRCDAGECDCRTDPAYRHLWERDAWARLAASTGGDAREMAEAVSENPADGTAR
ncbi:hypothetical protein PUR57_35070 [Streptomyces sp. JV176]|uniref:hypothetical protein n=1 Tax=Streptomyces sp. JV176 TaxID=858630 RepID=UPI002E795222|nr:hypothetical protein [Streptomyces sp. JV176]MEE1803834.1 hypothetical protein [Streptomyces sp. JV176]